MSEIIKKYNSTRQAVKKYSNQPIVAHDWELIKETILWSPSSHGFEPYRVLIIDSKNQDLRAELKPLMWNQNIVLEASKLIFFISLNSASFTNEKWLFERSLRKSEKIFEKQGSEAIEISKNQVSNILNHHLLPFENHDSWSMKQCYIALANAMYSANILGLGSTAIEGFHRDDLESLFKSKQLIQDNEKVAVALAIGYPESDSSYAHKGKGLRVRDSITFKITEI